MANDCYFDMNIVGERAAVQELTQMMKWKGPFEENGLGRIFSLDIYAEELIGKQGEKEWVSVKCSGDCAWSILSSMLRDEDRFPCLESETKRLGLALEAYSSEPGIGFQEHYVICKGDILVEEEKDYQEHWVDSLTEEELLEVCQQMDILPEQVKEHVNENGDLCIGGFGDDFAHFQDLSKYVMDFIQPPYPSRPSLNELIETAKDQKDAGFEHLSEKIDERSR